MQDTPFWSLGWDDPLEKEMQPTTISLHGKSRGQRRLAGYRPWVCKELDMTEVTKQQQQQGQRIHKQWSIYWPWINFSWWRNNEHHDNDPDVKDLNDPDPHLEPDILDCNVKRGLGSITMNKPSGDDGIPAELFQIWKDDAVKVLHSIGQQIWKTQQEPQDWKIPVFISIPKKGKAEECSKYHTVALISHTSKVMLKILQAWLQ